MNENISAMARLALDVIILSMLVCSVTNLLTITSTMLSKGVISLSVSSEAIQLKPYEKYDGNKVYGSEVKDAIKGMSNLNYAIVVRNKSNLGIVNEDGSKVAGGNKVYKRDDIWAYNYGELIVPGNSHSEENPVNNSTYQVKEPGYLVQILKTPPDREEGSRFYTANLYINEHNETVSSNDLTGLTRMGGPEYIADGAFYKCSWIKDINGEFVGIYAKFIE